MKQRWLWMLVLMLGPGLGIGLAVIGYGLFLKPPRYEIAAWKETWTEPKKLPAGVFQSFRALPDSTDLVVIGETEPWPHKHPRANSYLLSTGAYAGDVEVSLLARFLRGRYLGCYLCYDPQAGNGYWLATGHAVGEEPNQAYIKIVHSGTWEVMAQAPLEIVPEREYRLAFCRSGAQLWVKVDGKKVVEWQNEEFSAGHVQLRLHNTKVAIRDLKILGTLIDPAGPADRRGDAGDSPGS